MILYLIQVCGESRSGGVRASCPASIAVGRESTFVGLRENGHVELGLNRGNLPFLKEIKLPTSSVAQPSNSEESGNNI